MLERTVQAWHDLESEPVRMAYAHTDDTVVSQADSVRERAAALLRCDADEMLITRSTTDGMDTVAQRMRWSTADRVLTTDQEHEGGRFCWQYQVRRHGVAIDRVAIGFDEHDTAAIVQRFAYAQSLPRTRPGANGGLVAEIRHQSRPADGRASQAPITPNALPSIARCCEKHLSDELEHPIKRLIFTVPRQRDRPACGQASS